MKIRATTSEIPRTGSRSIPGGWSRPNPTPHDLGLTETLFAIGNGYLGMRANPSEGRDAHSHGTYLNGFHETWEIQHAEEAFGFRQDRPDDRQRARRQADEAVRRRRAAAARRRPTSTTTSGRSTSAPAISYRELVWRTPAGKRVRVRIRAHGEPRAPPPRRAARSRSRCSTATHRSSSRRSCSTARTARTSTTSPRRALGEGERPATGPQVRSTACSSPSSSGTTHHDDPAGGEVVARLPVRQQRHDAGVRVPCT